MDDDYDDYDDYEPDFSSVEFQMYGHGGFGYDTSHVPADDPEPQIVRAAKSGDLETVRTLVESAKGDAERRRLLNASGRWTEVDYKMSGFTKEYEWHGPTPLIAAADAGCSETVEYLLRRGADPTLKGSPSDDCYLTALTAAERGSRLNRPETFLTSNISLATSLTDPPMDAARRIFKRKNGHHRSVNLLKEAEKFWNQASYSNCSYSKERENSGFPNEPTDKEGLSRALDEVPPLPVPSDEELEGLAAGITELREIRRRAKEARSETKPRSKQNKSSSRKKKTTTTTVKRCKFFAQGRCRYGDECRFSHTL